MGTITAAAIGTVVAVDAGTIELRVVGDGLNSTELQTAVDRLEAENAELRSVNDDIQAQIDDLQLQAEPAAEDPDRAASPSATPEDSTVRRATREPIGLASEGCLDLDSDAPNWDVAGEGDICIWYYQRDLVGTNLTVLDEEPTLADCEAQTDVRDSVGAIGSLVGKYICGWTDNGRLARIGIVDTSQGKNGRTESAMLQITVWEQQH
ncbi:hypothetical protein [Promicromonospora sp. NPDC023805]|uniref:hypothetical protein n=1 Tax=Promicromonospora sp. NPDC023805 TaxID=3154696 RepID=UPI0033F12BBC